MKSGLMQKSGSGWVWMSLLTARRVLCRRSPSNSASMVVARYALGLGDLLIFDRWLQHHAFGKLIDIGAEDLLPWRLALRHAISSVGEEIAPPLVELFLWNEDVGGALVEIDPHPI